MYIRLFQHHESSRVASTLGAVVGLFIALLTTALVPVDVFLVSYMKNADGSYKVGLYQKYFLVAPEFTLEYKFELLRKCPEP